MNKKIVMLALIFVLASVVFVSENQRTQHIIVPPDKPLIIPASKFAKTGAFTPLKTVDNLYVIALSDGNMFYNYDFNSKSASSDNVDWPVTIIFFGHAYDENYVYSVLKSIAKYALGTPSSYGGGDSYWLASTKYGLTYWGGSWHWDGTDGFKFFDVIHDDWEDDWEVHIRVYNGGYDPNWGYWCIATTHVEQFAYLDRNAQNPELGEDYIAQVFKNAGYSVWEDYYYIYNYIPGTPGSIWGEYEGQSGNYYNNGYVTLIYLP